MTVITGKDFFLDRLKAAKVPMTEELEKILGSEDFTKLEIPTTIADPIRNLISKDVALKHPDINREIMGKVKGSLETAFKQDAKQNQGWTDEEWKEFSEGKTVVDIAREYPSSIRTVYESKLQDLEGADAEKIKAEMEAHYGTQVSTLKARSEEFQKLYKEAVEKSKSVEKAMGEALLEKDRLHYFSGIYGNVVLKGAAKENPDFRKFIFEQAFGKMKSQFVIRPDETTQDWALFEPDGLTHAMSENKTSLLDPKEVFLTLIQEHIDPTGGKASGGGTPGGGNGGGYVPPKKPAQGNPYKFGGPGYGGGMVQQ